MIKQDEGYNDTLARLFAWKYPNKKAIEATVQVTEGCTLACTYCYQHDKSPKKMSLEVGKKYIDTIFKDLKDTHYAVILDFIGGEPLLEPELISKICDYWEYQCIMHYPEVPWGLYTRYSLCSNGTEWDKPEVQKLINKIGSRLSFTVSIDGNKELHDSARVHPNGAGSYEEAIHAATDYERRFHIELGSKMTIAPNNLIFLYGALKHYLDSGKKVIHANTVYEDVWKIEDAQLYYKELKKLADYKLKNYPEVYLSLFDENLFQPDDPNEMTTYCGGNGLMLACDPDGVLYPCLRYMPTSVGRNRDYYITCGDVDHGIDKQTLQLMQTVTRRSYSDDECFYCPISKGCGNCAAYNWETYGTLNQRTKFHCDMHHARALANVYYWNKYYKQTNQDKKFYNNVPDNRALRIIDKEELIMLNNLVVN